MSRISHYSLELRERAARMVKDNRAGCLHFHLESVRNVGRKHLAPGFERLRSTPALAPGSPNAGTLG